MTVSDPQRFQPADVGALALHLQQVCRGCDLLASCRRETACPVMRSRELVGDYISGGPEVVAGAITALVPEGAQITAPPLEEVLQTVHGLCGGCHYHVNDCVLNRVYSLVEQGLGRSGNKPVGQKPGRQHRGGAGE